MQPPTALVYRWIVYFALACASLPALALKPSYEMDRLLLAAELAFDENNTSLAEDYLQQALQLGVALPPEYDFLYGKLLSQRNKSIEAKSRLEQYVNRTGDKGQYYKEALNLITAIEKTKTRQTAKPASGIQPTIQWEDPSAAYVAKIQQLYKGSSAVKALETHTNNLLKFYTYGDERVVAASRMGTPTQHKIQTNRAGDIITLSRSLTKKQQPYSEERLNVYGINPYVSYKCYGATASCWILHPVSKRRWLQIVQNEQAAEELSKAITQLIRRMQKRN